MNFNKEQILNPYKFNFAYAHDLVSDVKDDFMHKSPSPGLENHPGFTLGHLITGSMLVARSLGDMVMFMCVTHEAMHLAQVAAWRRSFGMDSSLGRL